MRDPMSAFDKIISEAQKEGKFEDLSGKGKPLVIDTSPDAVVKGLLKEANVPVAPEWITLAIEIDRLLEEDGRAVAEFAAGYQAGRTALAGTAPRVEVPAAVPEPWWRRWWRVLVHGWGERSARGQPTATAPAEPGTALQQRWDRELARHAGRLHDGNRKIRRFNQIVPLANRQRPLLPVDARLQAFAERFPRPERAPEGGWQYVRAPIPASLLTPPPEKAETEARPRDVAHAAALMRLRQGGRKPPAIG